MHVPHVHIGDVQQKMGELQSDLEFQFNSPFSPTMKEGVGKEGAVPEAGQQYTSTWSCVLLSG